MLPTFSFILTFVTLSSFTMAAPPPHPQGRCCKPEYATNAHHAHIVDNYLKLWYGDLTVLNDTLSPVISFHADRFPSSDGKGSVQIQLNSSEAFGEFVMTSRIGFKTYGFKPYYWLGQGNLVSIRWYLDGVIGPDFSNAKLQT